MSVCLITLCRADGSSEQLPLSADAAEDSTLPSGAGESSHDVDKQERIKRYVRMTIQNQAESRLAQNSAEQVTRLCFSLAMVKPVQ